jgi:cbb3-type cytochrome oxidase subunit 1
MSLKCRPFVDLEVVFDVGGRVIGHVIAVELALPEVSLYRFKHNNFPVPF